MKINDNIQFKYNRTEFSGEEDNKEMVNLGFKVGDKVSFEIGSEESPMIIIGVITNIHQCGIACISSKDMIADNVIMELSKLHKYKELEVKEITYLQWGFRDGLRSAEDCDIQKRGLYWLEGTGEHINYISEEERDVYCKGFWWGRDIYWNRKWKEKAENTPSCENISSYEERRFSCEDESIFYEDEI